MEFLNFHSNTRVRAHASWGLDLIGGLNMAAVYIHRNNSCGAPESKRKHRGMCAAKTRKGTPCQAPPVWNKTKDKPKNGRCKLHGGFSTGPKTETGKEAIKAGNRARAKTAYS